LNTQEIAGEIADFMAKDENRRYKIIIGSDSDGHNGLATDFATVIVVHRIGNGGRYFWRRAELSKFHTLRDRIIQEVLLSIEAAREILMALRAIKAPQFDFEIHVDIGEGGETKTMIQEVLGMIRAYGEQYAQYIGSSRYNFEARTKPESYAATKVADRHV
jgi:predicted RNase H-related nuclease YkuK (DUF458 family)